MSTGPVPPKAPHAPTGTQRGLARVIFGLTHGITATQRLRVGDPHGGLALAQRGPVVFALWHNRSALSLYIYRRLFHRPDPRRRLAALASASRDGALMAAVLELFGAAPVRGSSSRRGLLAAAELIDAARAGADLAITPDGPRGPRYVVQPGAVAVAQATGRPIVPVGINTRWRFNARSWDGYQVPLPFARVEVVFGSALDPREHRGAGGREWLRAELQRELEAVTRD
ncbi:MAG: lysophospholipid acyltransferase family protein [Limisphaerales bacterium]